MAMSLRPWFKRTAPSMDPPVYSLQKSNRPSKIGQSSPKLYFCIEVACSCCVSGVIFERKST
jgi:hypothetical protein